MIVDCHAHYVPAALLERLKTAGARFPSIQMLHEGDNFRFAFMGGPPTRPIMPRLREVKERFSWMDSQGIDKQVVAGWLDMFAYEIRADEAAEWSRFLNAEMLAATRSLPCRSRWWRRHGSAPRRGTRCSAARPRCCSGSARNQARSRGWAPVSTRT
ncbi:MAG: hypothetical protein EXQ87_03110 [Alphaproteobacteria bacterium]|nr:hypothetical protein [Alphaproteobacteria bacterium]